jgi:hypothetical protein
MRQSRANYRRWACIALGAVFFLVLLPSCALLSRYSDSADCTADWSTVQVPDGTFGTTSASSTMSESEYKSHCLHVSYKDFQNDANAHRGEGIYVKGRLASVPPLYDVRLPSLSGVSPEAAAVVELALDDVPDTLQGVPAWVLWPRPLPPVMQEVANQFVEVWGECQGSFSSGAPTIGQDDPNMPVVRVRYMTVHTP